MAWISGVFKPKFLVDLPILGISVPVVKHGDFQKGSRHQMSLVVGLVSICQNFPLLNDVLNGAIFVRQQLLRLLTQPVLLVLVQNVAEGGIVLGCFWISPSWLPHFDREIHKCMQIVLWISRIQRLQELWRILNVKVHLG